MMESLCATIVTYEPGPELMANISSYIDHVAAIFVIDNSEQMDPKQLQELLLHPKIKLIINGENRGVATALNMGAAMAREKGFQWMLTMDQDSSFAPEVISQYVRCFQAIQSDRLGMIGIEFNPNKAKINIGDACETAEVDSLITSGSILNLQHWTSLKGFNEDLFIDGVDDEYCLRLIQNQLQVKIFVNLHLNHQLGNDVWVRNWHIGAKVKRNIHSPIRMYYMMRNYLYLIHRFQHDFPEKTKEYKKVLVNKIKNNVLYHPKRLSTLSMLWKGWYHFKKKRWGKL